MYTYIHTYISNECVRSAKQGWFGWKLQKRHSTCFNSWFLLVYSDEKLSGCDFLAEL